MEECALIRSDVKKKVFKKKQNALHGTKPSHFSEHSILIGKQGAAESMNLFLELLRVDGKLHRAYSIVSKEILVQAINS